MIDNRQLANYKLKLSKAELNSQNLVFWYLIQFTDIGIKLFKYKGFPDYIPLDIVERNIFNEGKSLFFEDKEIGFLCLPTTAFSKYNEYGQPVEYQAIGFNGKTWKRNMTNSVLIKNSPTMSPCLPTIYEYCKELANYRQAININVNSSKTPFIFSGTKEQLLTLKNIYKKISENEPITYTETGVLQELKVLNTQAPFIADKLDYLFNSTLGKCLTYLGINNNQVEKQERLTNDEVNSNNDFITANLKARLDCRKEACDKINKMFGLNTSVEINEEYLEDLTKILNSIDNQGGEDNGSGINRQIYTKFI